MRQSLKSAVAHLPAALRDDYLHTFAGPMHTVYLGAACVALLAFTLSWFLQDHRLRKR